MNDRVWTSSEVPATAPGRTGARHSRVSISCRSNTAPRYHPIRCPHSSPAPFAGRSTWVGNAGRHRTYCAGAGRHYLIGRYYDPQTGQFLSVDPKVQATEQAYIYVGDNPVNASDPSGQGSQCYNSNPKKQEECIAKQNAEWVAANKACPSGYYNSEGRCYTPAATAAGMPCPDVAADGMTCLSAAWNANNPFAGAPNGYVKICGVGLFGGVGVCLAFADNGDVYIAPEVGVGTPGVTISSGVVNVCSSSSLLGGGSYDVGATPFGIGGGWSWNSGASGPNWSVGTPGAGWFWSYGFKL